MTKRPPLRIIVADDHYLVREGLRALLADGGAVDVCATVHSAPALIETVDRHRRNGNPEPYPVFRRVA